MKKTLIAAALFAVFGAAHAYDSVGTSTNNNIVQVGGSTFADTHFHGPNGAPGVGFVETSSGAGDGFIISLQSINPYSYKDSSTTSGGVAFQRYQLLGYTHEDPEEGGTVSTNFNWFKVPTISQQVYFGIATNDPTSSTARRDAAFEVGDQTGCVVPNSATSYATAGFLVPSGYTSTTPIILTGTLNLAVSGTTATSLSGDLSGSSYNLNIAANTINSTAGTFSGDSTLSGAATGSGTSSGHFYGSGTTSAVAGVAASDATSATAYVASFGGIKN
ncbi:hypothetical protein [Xylophilus sp.]|uniref:hypothetical protein n=1 Tax=Xylophilus sp. TaxID=2653893 RepID=UPI0013BC664C|nr:hypothetical protein [Xylophilus sp.]KAF1047391.1 MAG: hypothetical protein GAK38_01910 [Xylophilus sp.]